MAHEYPVGKAQAMVLAALGKTAGSFQEAEQTFERLGIVVTSKRAGRSVVPVVSLREREGGGRNAWGEGESWTISYEPCDLTPLAQWMA